MEIELVTVMRWLRTHQYLRDTLSLTELLAAYKRDYLDDSYITVNVLLYCIRIQQGNR